MKCICGGTLNLKEGISKYNKPYAFWGCDNFRNGCKQSLTNDEYIALRKRGLDQVPENEQKAARSWIKSGHRAYLPSPRTNPNRAALLAYRKLTDEQEAIIARISMPGAHRIRVNADAGTGKSTLLKQIAARITAQKNEFTTGIILTFGKKPSDEMAAALPFNWVATTVHSAGNDAVAAYFGINKRTPNEYKTKEMLRDLYGVANEPDRILLYSAVMDLVDMSKALLLSATSTDDAILEQATFYNTNVGPSPAEACTMTREILHKGSTQAYIARYGHDFADMIYLPVILNLPVAQYRYVAVDEAQDSSPARMQLALRMCKHSLIIVGDWMQSIMGFSYADTRAMDTFATLMGDTTVDYPITINWRCPSVILDMARILCPTIQARSNAPRGNIYAINDEQLLTTVQSGDLILCRVNADLIKTAYMLIKQGTGAVVLGRDIAHNLKNIIIRLGSNGNGGYIDTLPFLARLNEWNEKETAVLNAKNLRNPDKAFQKLDDDYFCILALCGVEITDEMSIKSVGITSIARVLEKIDVMFGETTDSMFDAKNIVTLSTIHKFKGGQSARVFLLNAAANHPHPMAKTDWELQQETCVLHVALTRCGDGTEHPDQALYFVNGLPIELQEGAHYVSVVNP